MRLSEDCLALNPEYLDLNNRDARKEPSVLCSCLIQFVILLFHLTDYDHGW